ncbi:MAG TPA: hypothetical protein VE548_06035 [Nitrososphaeraceae archaeon]|jgi:putative effector of murein hydrolase LrgA (UPF0299 family)|nr:hypothetical protein [Nitrososphaeraceae archaeon]
MQKPEPISNLMILMIALMTVGTWVAASFFIPFPYSIIAVVAANFFILRYYFKREKKRGANNH